MIEYEIVFGSVDDVNDFVNSVRDIDCPMELEQGRYKVNSKSVMGIFSLDITHPMIFRAYTDNANNIYTAIKNFICNKE